MLSFRELENLPKPTPSRVVITQKQLNVSTNITLEKGPFIK